MGFPKIRDTISGLPIIRIAVVWGTYWGPPIRNGETTKCSAKIPDLCGHFYTWTGLSIYMQAYGGAQTSNLKVWGLGRISHLHPKSHS